MQSISAFELLESRQLLSLTIDVRLAGGGKEVTVDHVGQVVDLEAWAVVKGNNADISDDAVQTVVGSFLSTNAGGIGSARGSLSAKLVAPFNANGSQAGSQSDLDSDGDLDLGSNNDADATGFFASRSATPTADGQASALGGAEFKVADVTFTVTSLLVGSETDINYRQRNPAAGGAVALWREDGAVTVLVPQTGTFLTGTPVVVHSTGANGPSSIDGVVFNDTNQSTVQDAGESALAGWTVFLDSNQNGALDAGEVSTTTDSNGAYHFDNLTSAVYHVAQVRSAGYAQILPADAEYTIDLQASENRHGMNFANSTLGQIRGLAFDDLNGDGVLNGADAGQSGLGVYIDANHNGKRDNGETTTDTDAQGFYTLKLLPAGQYDVRLLPASSADVIKPASRLVNLPAATVITGQDFARGVIEATISGKLIIDNNDNGIVDPGDNGGVGTNVFLDANGNLKWDPNELFASADPSGNYRFDHVPPGNYTLMPDLEPANPFRVSAPAAKQYAITVNQVGQMISGKDFLFTMQPERLATITGVVYNDANANGVRDAGETGLGNWGVYLDTNHNALFDKGEPFTTTLSNGEYTFSNLQAGSYRVRELLYADYRRVTPDSGYYDLSLNGGDVASNKLFGNTKLGFVKGNVFKDLNGNGVRDGNEAGLAGFRVWDDLDGDGVLDANEPSALTDANGNYTLNVQAGWHTIRVQPKAGYRWSGILYYKVLTGLSTRAYDRNFGERPIV